MSSIAATTATVRKPIYHSLFTQVLAALLLPRRGACSTATNWWM